HRRDTVATRTPNPGGVNSHSIQSRMRVVPSAEGVRQMKAGSVLLIGLAIGAFAAESAPARAVEPVGGNTFNVSSHVDLAALTRDNFAAVVEPIAKGQTQREIVFYDFADTLCELLAGEIARFTTETGIPAKHVCVDGDAATQQLIAAKQAN